MQYRFPANIGALTIVSDHMDNLDINIISLVKQGLFYFMTTDVAIPVEQLEHLEMEIV